MSTRSIARLLAGAGLAAAALLFAAPHAGARDRGQPPVMVPPDLEREWLLQLAPGSGVVPGYRRPDLQRAATPGAAARRYPGYGAARAGEGWSALPPRSSAPAAPSAAARFGYASPRGGLFGGPAKPLRPAAPATAAARPGLDPAFLPQEVEYRTAEKPGTVVIDTEARFLYLVEADGRARRYGVGVGKPGFEWAGRHAVSRKAEWPDWTPPAEMRAREAAKGRVLPARMDGGTANPLGARAMYLGSTLYRIHGTNQPWTIGRAVSSGCIRMRNEDVTDLYERVGVGTAVVVL